MSAWVIFRRARSILFAFLVLGCLTWAIFFAVFLYNGWSYFSRLQKIVVVGLVSLYVFTAILLYLMAVVIFRFWWEVARIFALLVLHTGSSVLFMHYSPGLPCRSFGTESSCRTFIHTITVGCWVFSGIILCFAIILGIIHFFPRPVESLPEPESEENEKVPLSPASFGARSPMDEWRRMSSSDSIDSHTGLVTYNDKTVLQDASSFSPDRDSNPFNEAQQETITVGPPRISLGFRSPGLRLGHKDSMNNDIISTRETPGDRANAVSRPQRVESFKSNPFRDPMSPPVSVHSLALTNRTGVGGETSSISEDRPILSPAFPEPIHRALSPIALRDSPPLLTTRRDCTAEYTPVLSSTLSHYPPPVTFGSSAQQQTPPDRAQAATPGARSFHSLAVSVHPKWAASNPHAPPPPALTPGTALFRGHSVSFGLKNTSSAYNAPFGTWGSTPGLRRQVSEPFRSLRRFSENTAHRSYTPRVKETDFPRRGSDGQVLDRTQWQQLVLNAAAKQ